MALNAPVPVSNSPEVIGAAVLRILSSDAFAGSKRLQRFLAYVVEKALAGQTNDLKEYDIALAVFDRDSTFDPRMDSIVRVEARRLRQQLAVYYQAAGREDPLVITLPRGGYVPVFYNRSAAKLDSEAPEAQQTELPGPAVLPVPKNPTSIYKAVAGVSVVVAATTALLWFSGILPRAHVPHHWRLVNSKLTILDANEGILWEKQFPPLSPDTIHYQEKVLIADVDGDGRNEVLFNSRPEKIAENGGSLLCFDYAGALRWEFRYGRRVAFGTRRFDPSFGAHFVRLVKTARQTYILTVASHYLWYPAQAALLDPKTGRVVEEYWHPGVIYHVALQDLNGDGQDELLLGAINNPGDGLGHAGLAVLTLPFSAAPAWPARRGDPVLPKLGGGELAYLLFPLPDVCRTMGKLPIMIRLHIDQNRRILVQTPLAEEGGVVYYLDFNLNLLEHRFSDNFTALHQRYHRQGLLDHSLTPEELASLGKVVRFDAAPDGNSPELRRLWPYY